MTGFLVNRALRRLREGGLVTCRSGRVSFHVYNRLISEAGFDPSYMDQEGPLLT